MFTSTHDCDTRAVDRCRVQGVKGAGRCSWSTRACRSGGELAGGRHRATARSAPAGSGEAGWRQVQPARRKLALGVSKRRCLLLLLLLLPSRLQRRQPCRMLRRLHRWRGCRTAAARLYRGRRRRRGSCPRRAHRRQGRLCQLLEERVGRQPGSQACLRRAQREWHNDAAGVRLVRQGQQASQATTHRRTDAQAVGACCGRQAALEVCPTAPGLLATTVEAGLLALPAPSHEAQAQRRSWTSTGRSESAAAVRGRGASSCRRRRQAAEATRPPPHPRRSATRPHLPLTCNSAEQPAGGSYRPKIALASLHGLPPRLASAKTATMGSGANKIRAGKGGQRLNLRRAAPQRRYTVLPSLAVHSAPLPLHILFI